MYIFIQYKFIEDFFIIYDNENEESNGKGLNILNEVLRRFPLKKIIIDLSDNEEWDKKKLEVPLLEVIEDSSTWIAYSNNLEEEIKDFDLDVPAFAFTNYSNEANLELTNERIKVMSIEQVDEILPVIKGLDVEYDLDILDDEDEDSWPGWEVLNGINSTARKIVLADNYLFNFRIKKGSYQLESKSLTHNLVPLVENLLDKHDVLKELAIYVDFSKTDEFNHYEDNLKIEDVKLSHTQRIEIIKTTLNRLLSRFKVRIEIINTYVPFSDKKAEDINIHDRRCYTNYCIIYCGSGFTLYKKGERYYTDSIFRIQSVLSRQVYKRWMRQIGNLSKISLT